MEPKLAMDGGYLGEVIGERSVQAMPQPPNCSSLASSLQNIAVVDNPELAEQWIEKAYPNMKSRCLPA